MGYNSTYFTEVILPSLLSDKVKICHGKTCSQLWLHMENCRVHNSKMTQTFCDHNGIIRTPHPTYSLDIAPSDFYLFALVKENLKGKKFYSQQSLIQGINEILDTIEETKIKEAFSTWICRCLDAIDNKGYY